MPEVNVDKASTTERTQLRAGVLGTGALVFTVVAMVGPMAAFMGAAPLVFLLGGAGASGIYLLATVLFLVFAVGYLAMSRRMGNASGFISFIASGLGRRSGAAAAYVTLLTYVAFLAGLYGIYALFLQQAFIEFFGLDLPWGFWALATVAVLGVLSYNRVEFSARIMGVLLVLAVAAVLVLDVAILIQGGDGGGLSFVGFTPQAVFGAGFGLAALFALGSFGGVESTAVFSEEVRAPARTVPRAMYISILVLGIFYVFSTFVIANAVGVDNVLELAGADPTGFIFVIAGDYLGVVWVKILNALVVTSFFAVLLGFTNITSRYIFSMGRAGILPAVVGTSHRKHQSPHIASVVVAVVVAVVIGIFIVTGGDPFAQLYTWFLAVAVVGMLLLTGASSVAAIAYFRGNREQENIWQTVISPAIAALAFAGAIGLTIANFSVLAGGEGFAQWLWVVVPLTAIAGFAVGSMKRHRALTFSSLG